MAKNMSNKYTSKSRGAHYLILVGAIILLIGFGVLVFARSVAAGGVLLLIGILVCAVGLSKHSLHLLKRKAGKS